MNGYSQLAQHYMAANGATGHSRFCAYAAGADCTCGKFNVDAGHDRNCVYAHPDEPGGCTCSVSGEPVAVTAAPATAAPALSDDDLPF